MKVRVFILAFAVFSLFGLGSTAMAETTPERRLLVSPVRNELTVDAGSAYKGALTLKNTGTTPLVVNLSAEEFNVTNETYDYSFMPKSLVNEWVHFAQPSVTLSANETFIAQYLISIPLGAEPGGTYISLFASAQPSGNTGITSTDRVGSLIYLTINGDITKKGELLTLNSPFITTGTIQWSATIRNGGTAHFRSEYHVQLRTLWNKEVATTKESRLILPASVRLIQGEVAHPKWLGLYRIQYTIPLGDNGTIERSYFIAYLPPIQTIPVVAFIALLIVAIIYFVRKRRATKNQS